MVASGETSRFACVAADAGNGSFHAEPCGCGKIAPLQPRGTANRRFTQASKRIRKGLRNPVAIPSLRGIEHDV